MNAPETATILEPAEKRRFSWRKFFQKSLVFLSIISLLVIGFYNEEKLRGWMSWNHYRTQLEAQGYMFNMADLAPPLVPDHLNFAQHPSLACIYDFKPGTQIQRNTNDYQQLLDRIDAVNKAARKQGYQSFPRLNGQWHYAQFNDMNKLLGRRTNAFVPIMKNINGQNIKVIGVSNIVVHILEPTVIASNVLQLYASTSTGVLLDELQATRHQRPSCRFKIPYHLFPKDVSYLHRNPVYDIARHYLVRSLAKLQLGQTDAAFEDVMMVLFLGECFRDEPFMLAAQARIGGRQMVLQCIWEGLARHQWSSNQVAQFQTRLDEYNILADGPKIFEWDRIYMNGMIDFARTNWHEFKMDCMSDEEEDGHDSCLSKEQFVIAYLYPKGWLYLEQKLCNESQIQLYRQYLMFEGGIINPDKVEAYQDQVDGYFLPAPFWKNYSVHQMLFAGNLYPRQKWACIKLANSQTANNLALVACALERYRMAQGQYPEKLEDLVPDKLAHLPFDVVNGMPLRYRTKLDGTFILYSVGWNNKDDDGMITDRDVKGFPIEDKGDWVWQYTTPNIQVQGKTPANAK
jgi:hypothetical protein